MSSALLARTIIQCQLKGFTRLGSLRIVTQRRFLGDESEIEEHLKKYREGNYEKLPRPDHLEHFRQSSKPVTELMPDGEVKPMGAVAMPHPIWSEKELHEVKITHKEPKGFVEKTAYYLVQTMRTAFDIISGFKYGQRDEHKWVKRIIFLETVAGVPGMVAAMTRHLHSLRKLRRDYGWIHTLLEEAENERMHLMTALQLRQPTYLFRLGIIVSQGAFVTLFSLSYLVSPRFCHRFVGYLEEEAVKTYTKCLQDIEDGPLKHWQTTPGPEVAITYWKMKPDSTMKDVILAIRADEAHHRLVNHTLASLKNTDFNPFEPGK